MDRTDWKRSPHWIFSAAVSAREASHHLPDGCSQGVLVHRDWVGTWNGTGNGPMASSAFEPLYSAHPVRMMGCDDWELGEEICAHSA